MARKQSPTLTEAELPIMEILWLKGSAVVTDVVGALSNSVVAYNTVLTTLRILERKGYVRHTKEGRAFVYHPVVERGEASRKAVRNLLKRFFQDSPELLILNVLEDEQLDESELKRLKRLISGETSSEAGGAQ
ncbi:MAG TPA: BlaI/MecI/CopY family transcriptional regulator [Bryobacteraceae bacterium]|nr:BlaI/MecI/CopY family transcriptional regulator [Bryobacteraceae bacterium]